MSLRSTFEDLRLTFVYLPLVARVRWKLSRAPFAACSKAWGEDATQQLNAARAQSAAPLVPFEIWRRAHAVRRAARIIPEASCLTQALTLQSVLASHGESCKLILGVDKSSKPNPKRDFEAHAWIEWNGKVLVGGPVDRWKPLLVVAPQEQALLVDERAQATATVIATPSPATQ